jgi:hypothetical protein
MMYILFSMKKFRNYAAAVSCHTEQGRIMFNRRMQYFSRRSFRAMAGMNTFFNKRRYNSVFFYQNIYRL